MTIPIWLYILLIPFACYGLIQILANLFFILLQRGDEKISNKEVERYLNNDK